MAKAAKSQFVCQNCGAVASRWAGKCVACGEWNTLVEEADVAAAPGSGLARASKGRVVDAGDAGQDHGPRIARMPTGLAELDRVTGGGIVPGSALLIGGEPGIGKSTLLLQLAAAFANAGRRAIYFSGEEAAAQVRLRAERLGLSQAPLALACETNLANILATLAEGKRPDLVVVDSIQTLWADGARGRARHREPGARRHPVADPLRQGAGRRPRARRPRHQGRADRRPQGDRAHGRHRALLRGRPRPRLPHPARRQEPLRRHRRDRRVRDGVGRPARGRQPLRAVPRRPAGLDAGIGGVRRRGGDAADPGRDPGAGGSLRARHAAARGGRLGRQSARPCCLPSSTPAAASALPSTTSISTSPAA